MDIVIVYFSGKVGKFAAVALAEDLPTIYEYRAHVTAGGIASYGVDLKW
jgi:hypothetical protein